MKKQLFILTFLSFFTSLFCLGQNRQNANQAPKKIFTSTLTLTTEAVKKKPYYKYKFYRSKKYNECKSDLLAKFSVGYDNDKKVILFIDDLKSNSKPIFQTFEKSSFKYETIRDFLDSTLELFAKQEYLNTCVYNYINSFSHYLVRTVDFEKIGQASTTTTSADLNSSENIVATFPLGAVPNGTYTITRADATISGNVVMYLPQNFTLKVSPDVENISWFFDKIILEEGATLDLSRQLVLNKPPTTNNGKDAITCFTGDRECCGGPGYGDSGGDGQPGKKGENGLNGTNLTLRQDLFQMLATYGLEQMEEMLEKAVMVEMAEEEIGVHVAHRLPVVI